MMLEEAETLDFSKKKDQTTTHMKILLPTFTVV